MTLRMTNYACLLLAVAIGACGGASQVEAPSGSAPTPSSGPTASGGPAVTDVHVQDAGASPALAAVHDAGPPEAAPPDHPFAATSAEATSLIDAAIDAKIGGVSRCVEAARVRRKNPHNKISVEVGIDEQGHLMGVKAPPGGPKDADFYACVQQALTGANFPTSHAGIITVTKSFEEQAVYK